MELLEKLKELKNQADYRRSRGTLVEAAGPLWRFGGAVGAEAVAPNGRLSLVLELLEEL